MKKLLSLFILLATLTAGANGEYARKVNTLIGNKGVGLTSGYLYPGATYPDRKSVV